MGFLARFALTLVTALVVSVLVVYLWDLLAEGRGKLIGIFVTLAYTCKRRLFQLTVVTSTGKKI
jgi:hypothetical protein